MILSVELHLDVVREFPGLKVGDGNVQAREEEEVVEYKLEPFGKAAAPVRIYLKEMGRIARNVKRKVGRMEMKCGLSKGYLKKPKNVLDLLLFEGLNKNPKFRFSFIVILRLV